MSPSRKKPSQARSGRPGGATTTRSRPGAAKPAATGRPGALRPGAPSRTPPSARRSAGAGGPAFVVGEISPVARLAGAVAVAAALCLLLAPFFPLATARGGASAGSGVGGAANAFDLLPPLVLALALGGAGVLTALGRLPRLGMAAVAAFGAASLGGVLRTLFLYRSGRTSRDLPLPEAMVRTFRYDPATGLHLRLAAHVLAVVALGLVVWSWSRTWMEDDGTFDALRPLFGGLGLLVGCVGAAAVCLTVGDSGIQTVGPQSVAGRIGLDAWGSVVLAAVLIICGVTAPSLRPRLATTGMFVAFAALLLSDGFAGTLLVARSTGLSTGAGLPALYLAAALFAILAAGTWRMSRDPVDDPLTS